MSKWWVLHAQGAASATGRRLAVVHEELLTQAQPDSSQFVTLTREHAHWVTASLHADAGAAAEQAPQRTSACARMGLCVKDEGYFGTVLSYKPGHAKEHVSDDSAVAMLAPAEGAPEADISAELLMQIRGTPGRNSSLPMYYQGSAEHCRANERSGTCLPASRMHGLHLLLRMPARRCNCSVVQYML